MTTFRSAAHEAIVRSPYGYGYLPDDDKRRARQRPAHIRLAAGPEVAVRDISVGHFEGPLLDQGRTGHCTGTGTSQILSCSFGAAGTPLDFQPSPWLIYSLARILERSSARDPLSDSGAFPTDLIDVLRVWGIAPMQGPTPDGRNDDVWSDDDLAAAGITGIAANVNHEPSLVDLETAGLRLVTGDYRIDESKPDFGAQIRAALAGTSAVKPCAVGIGIFVDSAFQQWDPRRGPIASVNLADPLGGGHWLCLSYSYLTSSNAIVFGGPNSWSKAWPAAPDGGPPGSPYWTPGHYEITLDALQRVCTDCLLFPVQPLSALKEAA